MSKLYNIIGDTHGRTAWKKLVREDCVNIFVGDYFSPYDIISFDDQRNNYMDIVSYKDKHPETILLLGNHDEDHWHIRERYSRHDSAHVNDITELFEETKDYLQVAYSIENRALVTHAGVSMIWYERLLHKSLFSNICDCSYDDAEEIESPYDHKMHKVENPLLFSTMQSPMEAYVALNNKRHSQMPIVDSKPKPGQFVLWKGKVYIFDQEKDDFVYFDVTPDSVAKVVNDTWLSGKYSKFDFRSNCGPYDYYGDDDRHGPMWIRPDALTDSNIFTFTDYIQFVGHTQFPGITSVYNDRVKMVFTDCLGYEEQSALYNPETNEVKINYANDASVG